MLIGAFSVALFVAYQLTLRYDPVEEARKQACLDAGGTYDDVMDQCAVAPGSGGVRSGDPTLEPGQAWAYSDAPEGFGAVVQIVSVDELSAVVAIRNGKPPPRFVYLRLNPSKLRSSLRGTPFAGSGIGLEGEEPFDCRAHALWRCLDIYARLQDRDRSPAAPAS